MVPPTIMMIIMSVLLTCRGKLSPENLHLALSQTKKAAADYCSWFHKKVEEYAKN